LREKQREVDLQSEEMGVQNEELRVQLDDIHIRDEEVSRTNRALQESEQRFRATFEQAAVGIAQIDPDGRFIRINKRYCDIVGYTHDEILEKTFQDITYPADLDESQRNVQRLLDGEINTYTREKRYVRKDNSLVWVNFTVSLEHNEDGSPKYVIAVVEDITERKRAAEALRESEERFRQLADNSPIPIAINDKDDNITYLNKKFIVTFGYIREDIPDLSSWWPLAYPDPEYRVEAVKRWVKGVEEAIRESKDIGPIDYIVTCKDGSVRYTEISGATIGDKELVLLQDVTERKRAEEALRASERNLTDELEVARCLQQVSTRLIQAEEVDELYDQILETAMKIMHADFASVQIFHPERGELKLLGYRGFNPKAAKFWEWVRPASRSPCGVALGTSRRVAVPDILECDWMAGSDDLETLLQTGIRAVQTTPLLSRSGALLGMFSTHWREPHEMTVSEQQSLDILSRQAADLMARMQAESEVKEARDRLTVELNAMNRLHEISTRFVQQGDLSGLLNDILEASIDITGANMGTIQIVDGSHTMKIVAHRGFEQSYIDFFNNVCEETTAACGMALKLHERVIVEDVTSSPIFAGTPARDVHLAAGVRAVESTPIFSRSGELLGVLSTHYRTPRRPDDRDLKLIDMLSRQTADIIERKRADKVLRESEANLARAQLLTRLGNWTWDVKCDRMAGSTEFFRMFGFGDRQYIVYDEFLGRLHPDDREPVDRAVQATLSGTMPYSIDYRLMLPDGVEQVIHAEAEVTRDYAGQPVTMFGIVQDVTERRLVETELAEAKARAELYLDLMGHDINNMNQSAIGFLELALQTLEQDGKIGRSGKLFIEKPLQAVQSSSRLISNVRKLQRLADDGVRTRPIDLHDLFEELKVLDVYAIDKDTTINVQDVPHYLVEGSDLLRDIFLNLISNAVKHSEPDRPVTIDVGVERVDQDGRAYYRCTVEDNGLGVPDKLKSKLFHRFQRGKTQAHGKGLGLYLVRTLVEGYHGKVWVEDRVPGDHTKGAKFVVMLPAVEK
jgi:PAS domain S-box-containing protein